MCSTPFGDIDEFTQEPVCDMGVFRQMNSLDPAGCDRCSTPFGDIDEFTAVHYQRTGRGDECSTPFGDIDEFTTGVLTGAGTSRAVLNAFRRH